MLLSTSIQNARTILKTDINGLVNSDAISLANEAQYAVIADLIKRGINAAEIQESYESATTQIGTYLWPPDLWMLKELMVNYQDTTETNYLEAKPIDGGNLPEGQNIQYIRANQPTSQPIFENRGDWFEIFPAPNSTNNNNLTNFFWIFYFLAPTLFTSSVGDGSDVTVPYPLNLDPYLLSARIAMIQALRGTEEQQTRASSYASLYAQKLDTVENIIKRPSQKQIQPTGIPDNGYVY